MKYLPLALVLATSPAAALTLTADPQCHDPNGLNASCPDSYAFSEDNGTTWQVMDHAYPDAESIVVMHDMTPWQSIPGPHAWLVRAENAWGVSDEAPFDFTAGVPVAPFGLRLVAPPVE